LGNFLTASQLANSKHDPKKHEWLTEKFSLFLDHQANKTCGQFFPPLYEECFLMWPVTPTEEEISDANGNVAVATAKARQSEEHVRDFELTVLISGELIMIIDRGFTVGCITALARSMV
jgi:hypothetical protein